MVPVVAPNQQVRHELVAGTVCEFVRTHHYARLASLRQESLRLLQECECCKLVMAPTRVARLLLLAQITQALRVTRRSLAGAAGAAIPATAANAVRPPEFVTQQPGFTPTKSSLQIKDVKEGTGAAAAAGDRVVYEWEGYTIGYFGRPFEKKAGLKGGDFEGEKDYSRFVVGRGEVVPALEEGVLGVREGGVRQIIFPPELGVDACVEINQ